MLTEIYYEVDEFNRIGGPNNIWKKLQPTLQS